MAVGLWEPMHPLAECEVVDGSDLIVWEMHQQAPGFLPVWLAAILVLDWKVLAKGFLEPVLPPALRGVVDV